MQRTLLILIFVVVATNGCDVSDRRNNVEIRREKDFVRLSFTGGRTWRVSPEDTLTFVGNTSFYDRFYPRLVVGSNELIFDFFDEDWGPYKAAYFVNVSEEDAVDRARLHIRLAKEGAERLNSLIAENYVYLGWAVSNIEQLSCLLERRDKLGGLSEFGLTDEKVKRLGSVRPSDPNRKNIPVLFERISNRSLNKSHMWVLFLNGDVKKLEIGSRFPAEKKAVELIEEHYKNMNSEK